MSTGLGTVQRAIMAQLAKLPIEVAPPATIPVTVLAERLGCSARQIRRAVYALQRRGLVALTKEARPGRRGLSLMVWDARFYEAWMDFTDPVRIEMVTVPSRYVAGEESAAVNFINTGVAKPTFVPPRPFERGVRGRPTLVQNVETLAHIALIARFGADWFRDLGPAPAGVPGPGAGPAAGSALITVSGAVNRPGVYEIALGMPVGELVRWAGGPSERPQAFLAGGYFGGWLPYDQALGVAVSDPALRAVGAALGSGVLVLLPESACGLAETAWIAGFLATQGAGQCGPCVNGLPALASMLEQLAFGRPDREALGWAQRLVTLVARRGACHLPDGTAAFVASALDTFADEIRRHAAAGPCSRVRRRPVLPAPGYAWGQRR